MAILNQKRILNLIPKISAPVRAQRQAWRDRINELEALITNPTITPEDMVKAEEAALAKKE